MAASSGPTLRRWSGVGAVLVALLVAGLAAAAATAATAATQAGTKILISNVTVQADGTASMEVAVSPDVRSEAVEAGLRVIENGVLVEETRLERVGLTADTDQAEVALLMDVSGSTADNGALAAAQDAAADFVARVAGEKIPISLIAFASEPVVLATRSTDIAALVAAVRALQPAGETALYDAVATANQLLLESPARQREIVLFTDGGDTTSSALLADVAQAAGAAGATITAVSLTTTETDEESLSQLAAATNGLVLAVSDASGLGIVLDDVATSIASRLVVHWTVLDRTAPQLDVSVVLATATGQFTDREVVDSPLPALVEAGAPTPVRRPPPGLSPRPFLAGAFALWLGVGSATLAVLVLALVLLQSPANARAGRILRRQVAPSRRQRETKQGPPDDLRLKEVVGQVMDSLPRPSGYDERLQLELDRASWPLRSGEYVALRLGLLFGGGLLGAGLTVLRSIQAGAAAAEEAPASPVAGLVLPVSLAVLGWFVPKFILERRKQKRITDFHDQLPDTLQMIAGSLRAGYGLMQGMDNVSREGPAPSSTEFGRVLTETRLGIPLEEALSAMAERIGSEDFRWVTVAISIQRKVGGNLAELLDTVSATLRERDQVRRQVQVLSAEGRLSAVILVALPIVFALYLGTTNPDYLAPLFERSGLWLLAGAGVLMGFGIKWIQAVIKIDV